MMLLIALAITVAYGSSLAASLGWGDLDFWWELAALIVIMLLGHWQEMKAIGQAQGAFAALAALLPDTAERIAGDSVEEVAIVDLAVDDMVLVRPVAGPSRWCDRRRTSRVRRVHDHRRVPTTHPYRWRSGRRRDRVDGLLGAGPHRCGRGRHRTRWHPTPRR